MLDKNVLCSSLIYVCTVFEKQNKRVFIHWKALLSFISYRGRRRCGRVDCQWGSWGNWEECSETCDGGTQVRRRSIARHPSCGGSACRGLHTETRPCNTQCCPVDCIWGSWDELACSVTCGHGLKLRVRDIVHKKKCGGHCEGCSIDFTPCNLKACQSPSKFDINLPISTVAPKYPTIDVEDESSAAVQEEDQPEEDQPEKDQPISNGKSRGLYIIDVN